MTKLEIIEANIDPEEWSVAEVARLLRLTKPALIAEFKRRARNAAKAQRAWGNRRCKCGKLNKNCGDLMHAIEMIEPWPTPFLDAANKSKAPGMVHSWLEEEKSK
jgi:hypothetical protein